MRPSTIVINRKDFGPEAAVTLDYSRRAPLLVAVRIETLATPLAEIGFTVDMDKRIAGQASLSLSGGVSEAQRKYETMNRSAVDALYTEYGALLTRILHSPVIAIAEACMDLAEPSHQIQQFIGQHRVAKQAFLAKREVQIHSASLVHMTLTMAIEKGMSLPAEMAYTLTLLRHAMILAGRHYMSLSGNDEMPHSIRYLHQHHESVESAEESEASEAEGDSKVSD